MEDAKRAPIITDDNHRARFDSEDEDEVVETGIGEDDQLLAGHAMAQSDSVPAIIVDKSYRKTKDDDPDSARPQSCEIFTPEKTRWNPELANRTPRSKHQMPSTFNTQPDCVRKMSISKGGMRPTSKSNNYQNPPISSMDAHITTPMPIHPEEAISTDSDTLGPGVARWLPKVQSPSKTKLRRVTEKNGYANVSYKNISKKIRRRFFSDFYTTLVDSKWSTNLMLFAASFYLSWLIYAVIYYLICYSHGDFEPGHLPQNQSETGWTPCIYEVDGFAAAFLFSLETQHTIGYGSRQTTTECVMAMVVMSTQSVFGCLIQAFMVGLVFAKLCTPNKRAKTVAFSKYAVINERDRKLCLLFRVGDMRDDSFIVGAQISAKIIRRKITVEGEMFHNVQEFNITPDSSNESCIFLIWPITVVHVIDKDSPFYRLSAPELASDKFEILLTLEGTIESTSMTFQARTSYLPEEILWGHRFEPMMIYRRDHNKYQVNYAAFNSTYEVDTPLCSSRDLERYYKAKKERARQRQTKSISTNEQSKLPKSRGTSNSSDSSSSDSESSSSRSSSTSSVLSKTR